MTTQYSFIARISQTDFEITYEANTEEIGIVSIKVKGVEVGADGQLSRIIKAEVLKHFEINHKQTICLN